MHYCVLSIPINLFTHIHTHTHTHIHTHTHTHIHIHIHTHMHTHTHMHKHTHTHTHTHVCTHAQGIADETTGQDEYAVLQHGQPQAVPNIRDPNYGHLYQVKARGQGLYSTKHKWLSWFGMSIPSHMK